MPFESKAQMRWMFSKHPKMAKKWAEHTPAASKLPEYSNPKHSHPYSVDPFNPGKCMICGAGKVAHSIR